LVDITDIPDEPIVKAEIICTGNSEIDKQLGGGIPKGSLSLIEGESDAGKSVLSQQIMYGALLDQIRVIVFTTENSVKSLNTQMDSLGLSILDSILLGWIKIFPIESARMKQVDTLETLIAGMAAFPIYHLVIIDSLTPILAHTTSEAIISFFERCKKVCEEGRSIMVVAHTYAFNEQELIRLRSICDAHFRLRIEEVGDKLVKVLEVAKVRGAAKSTGNILNFDVDPGIGMRVMPMGRAKA
jgi:archaeal flagellar protein FlaH